MTQFVVIDVETGEREGGPFYNGSLAATKARVLADVKGRKYRVVKIAVSNVSDKPAWHNREQRLFDAGVYKKTPWHDEPWVIASHFAHVSRKSPSKLAFTKNDEHGERDIQTVMRPGRYLTAYYNDKLSQDDIRAWCGKYAAENEDIELKFATTPDEIEEVYTNGPRSCMSKKASYYDSSQHPVRVYGAGDLAVAYIENLECERAGDSEGGENSRITARAICWPEKKVYGRIYGDESRLRGLLQEAGFERGDSEFEGARLLRIEDEDGFIVPYLDNIVNVEDNGRFLVLAYDGDIECTNTNGLADCGVFCEHCEERTTGEIYTVGGETWCEYCRENDAFYCEGCNEDVAGECYLHTSNGDMCENCAENYTACATCDEYFDRGMREDINGDYHCEECASRLEETHCGMLADDAKACDCRECEQWREDHADLFGKAHEQDNKPREIASGLVLLKTTSPKVEDYNQLTMFIVGYRRLDGRITPTLSLEPYRIVELP